MPQLLLPVLLAALAVAGPPSIAPQANGAPTGDARAPKVDDLGPTVPGFVFVQEATGIPGRTETRAATQELLMTEKRLALIDHRSGQRFLMRLDEDPAGFYEISGDLKEYTRGKDYAKIQNQRDEAERELIRRRSDMSEAEWASTAKANHLRVDAPPGQRETELTISPAPQLELGEKKFNVERVVVTENGRVVVDALVTRDIDVKIPFFEFYRRLGAFSSEVLKELAKLEGVPIRAKFTVVTSTFAHPIEVVVRRLGHVQIPEFELARPPEAKEVEESAYVTCELSKVKIAKTKAWKHVLTNGSTVYFASAELWREYKRQNKDKIKVRKPKPGSGRPGGKPGGGKPGG